MISKALVAASTRPLILSILAREGESYGYEIIQRVKALSGGALQWSDGMLYPVLHRLEREGHVLSRWRTADSGRPRKYYALQQQGAEALEVEKKQWMQVHTTLMQLWSPTPGLI